MGKSMSTAKQVTRSTAVKAVTESVQPKPNQQILRAPPVPTEPTAAYLKEANSINAAFNDRLKQVFVTSVNKNPTLNLPKERSMPKDRTTPYAPTPHSQEADLKEPNTLQVDDLTVILKNFKGNPEKWNVDYIATKFDITKEIAEHLVSTYGVFHIYQTNLPETAKYVQKEEPVKRLRHNTTHVEAEEMLTTGVKKKYKTKLEVEQEWGEWANMEKKLKEMEKNQKK